MRELQQLFNLWASDPISFLRCVKIRDKRTQQLVPFVVWNEQKLLIDAYLKAKSEGKHVALLKARQIGSSTLYAALLFWEWFMAPAASNFAFYLHKQKPGRKFVIQWTEMYDSLPAWLRELRPLSTRTADMLVLEDTGATLERATAGGQGGARSSTYKAVIASEYPFWNNPDEIRATILGSMSNGTLIIESTANSFNDQLHQLFTQEDDRYIRIFLPWFTHEEYQEEPPPGWAPTSDLSDYQKLHGLTLSQLYWMDKKLQELGEAKFYREYPATVDDAYSVAGDVFITSSDMDDQEIVPGNIEGWTYLPDPQLDKPPMYVIGADAAGGDGGDFSSLYVINAWTRNPVACYRSNQVSPKEFARIIQETSTKYHDALILVECMTPGDVVLAHLREWGVTRLWTDDQGKDWKTTSASKPMGLHNLKQALLENVITQLDEVVYRELRSLTVKESGVIHFPKLESGHCDSVTALYLANHAASTVVLPQPVSRIEQRRRQDRARKQHSTRIY